MVVAKEVLNTLNVTDQNDWSRRAFSKKSIMELIAKNLAQPAGDWINDQETWIFWREMTR